MKTLFLFFLLINVAYFYFQSGAEENSTRSMLIKQPDLPSGAEPLVLLRERGLGSSESVQARAEVQSKNKPSKPVAKKVEATTPESQPKQVEKIAPLKTQAKSPAKLKKSAEAVCFTLGPFVKMQQADRAVKSANALAVKVVRRRESKRTPKGYWVYLSPSKSYKAAKRKVAELQKKGVKDLFIMGKGSRKNAISLGLFKNKKVAQDRLKQVNKLGLKAAFETQYRVSEQSWLDMSVAGDQTATVAALTEMADRFPKANLTQRKCQ